MSVKKNIPGLLEKYRVLGVSIAVIEDKRLVWHKGFGVKALDKEDPILETTVFEAASLSKPLFAYAALKWFQLNSIDTALSKYHPESYAAWNFQPSEDRLRQVTIRHVLSHLSGFNNWNCWDGPKVGKLKFFPGQEFSYSGEGYIYLQRVLEKLAEKPLQDIMQEIVLQPLAMSQSSYVWLPNYAACIASGYGQRNDDEIAAKKYTHLF